MKQVDRDLEYYRNNKTCLYCKHNSNGERNLQVICPHHFRGDCDSYLKEKFEWCNDDRRRELNKLVIEASQDKNTVDQISTVLVIVYFIATFISLGILIFLSLRLRFSNPQLTETQLFIESWHQFPEVELLVIFLLMLPKIFRMEVK